MHVEGHPHPISSSGTITILSHVSKCKSISTEKLARGDNEFIISQVTNIAKTEIHKANATIKLHILSHYISIVILVLSLLIV
jgi:hypothetical protein